LPSPAHLHVVQPLEAKLSSGLHFALSNLAASLAAQVSSAISKQVKAQMGGTEAIRKIVKDLMPALLEREFTRGLLDNEEGARKRRAMLVHVLTTADLRDFRLDPIGPLAARASEDEDDSLTSERAAELLHVSRTHLNTLLDAGLIGGVSRTSGGHRRIPKSAVLAYKEISKQRQARGLEAMAEASRSLGLYKDELKGIGRRTKR